MRRLLIYVICLLVSSSLYAAVSQKTYGPIKPSDNLWQIAEQYSPKQGDTLGQTILAIVRVNPNAFTDHNINGLKTGYVLKVPTEQEIYAITRDQAIVEIAKQNDLWLMKGQHYVGREAGSVDQLKAKVVKQNKVIADLLAQQNKHHSMSSYLKKTHKHQPPHYQLEHLQFLLVCTSLVIIVLLVLLVRYFRCRKPCGEPQQSQPQLIDGLHEEGIDAQLDLAMAYVELERIDEAKQLLALVIANGDESQKAQAHALLSKVKGE